MAACAALSLALAVVLAVGAEPDASGATSTAVVLAAGDIAGCDTSGDEQTAAVLDGQAGTVLTLGDNVYPNGTATEFQSCYAPTWGRHKARTSPSPGNHDYNTAAASGYFGYFGAAAGAPGQGYYSFDVGDWHVVSLNSELDTGAAGAQVQWLKSDLAATEAACVLAYWHKPRWTKGNYSDLLDGAAFWDALIDAGADVVLAGHDHNYQRYRPMNKAGAHDPVGGIRSFVVGTGGRSLYTLQSDSRREAGNGTTYGVLKLTLHARSYDWQFLPVAGQTYTDSGSASCSATTSSLEGRFVADFDGNGKDEHAVWRPSNGVWYVKGGSATQWGQGLLGDIPVPADYNGDGKDEIAIYRPSNGAWYLTGNYGGVHWGAPADVPVPGDYDGDGDEEFAVWRPSNGTWYANGDFPGVRWGQEGDIPVPGNYDADLADERAVFRPSNGRWYLEHEWSGTGWGQAGDIPVPGNYDVDGAWEFAVFRPASSKWYVYGDWGGVAWGQAGDIPLAHDSDADELDDLTTWRPANGTWYREGDFAGVQWGQEGDIP